MVASSSLRLIQSILQQGQVRRYGRTLGEVPHQIVPVPPLVILAGDCGMELSRQERWQIVILQQKRHMPGNDPAFTLRPRRRPRVNLHFDGQFLGRHSRQPRVMQEPSQAYPTCMHDLAVVPGHLSLEPGQRQVPFHLGHPVPPRVAFVRDQRKIQIFREARQVVQEAERRSPNEGQRPERLTFIERPQHEGLEILPEPVQGQSGIGHAAHQCQRLLFHSITVPSSTSVANSSQR